MDLTPALEHPDLPGFEPVVREIHHFLFRDGLDAFERRGKKLTRTMSRSDWRQFSRLCHRGYLKGQTILAEEIIAADQLQRDSEAAHKESKRKGRKPDRGAARMARVAALRLTVLRSLGDALALLVCRNEPWVFRRFLAHDQPTPVSASTIRKAVKTAIARNASDPLSFAVVTDLTHDIHVGDLLEIRLGNRPGLAVIELKEGKVNEELSTFVESEAGLNPVALEAISARFGEKGISQAKRMERQQLRMQQVRTALKEEEGVDLRTGHRWKTSAEYFEVEDWWEEFSSAVDQARSEGGSAVQIEGALQLVVLDLRQDPEKKDLILAKLLMHSLLAGSVGDSEDPVGTATKVNERLYPVRDLMGSVYTGEFAAPWLLPHLDPELVFDVVFGRVKILMHLDPPGLITLSGGLGRPLRWATRKENAYGSELPGTSDLDVFKGKRLMAASGPGNLGSGIVARVFYDFVRPSSAVGMVYHGHADLDEENETGEL